MQQRCRAVALYNGVTARTGYSATVRSTYTALVHSWNVSTELDNCHGSTGRPLMVSLSPQIMGHTQKTHKCSHHILCMRQDSSTRTSASPDSTKYMSLPWKDTSQWMLCFTTCPGLECAHKTLINRRLHSMCLGAPQTADQLAAAISIEAGNLATYSIAMAAPPSHENGRILPIGPQCACSKETLPVCVSAPMMQLWHQNLLISHWLRYWQHTISSGTTATHTSPIPNTYTLPYIHIKLQTTCVPCLSITNSNSL